MNLNVWQQGELRMRKNEDSVKSNSLRLKHQFYNFILKVIGDQKLEFVARKSETQNQNKNDI